MYFSCLPFCMPMCWYRMHVWNPFRKYRNTSRFSTRLTVVMTGQAKNLKWFVNHIGRHRPLGHVASNRDFNLQVSKIHTGTCALQNSQRAWRCSTAPKAKFHQFTVMFFKQVQAGDGKAIRRTLGRSTFKMKHTSINATLDKRSQRVQRDSTPNTYTHDHTVTHIHHTQWK